MKDKGHVVSEAVQGPGNHVCVHVTCNRCVSEDMMSAYIPWGDQVSAQAVDLPPQKCTWPPASRKGDSLYSEKQLRWSPFRTRNTNPRGTRIGSPREASWERGLVGEMPPSSALLRSQVNGNSSGRGRQRRGAGTECSRVPPSRLAKRQDTCIHTHTLTGNFQSSVGKCN